MSACTWYIVCHITSGYPVRVQVPGPPLYELLLLLLILALLVLARVVAIILLLLLLLLVVVLVVMVAVFGMLLVAAGESPLHAPAGQCIVCYKYQPIAFMFIGLKSIYPELPGKYTALSILANCWSSP